MKATVKGFNIALDNEAVKAIRFVLGFNTDLRACLNGVNTEMLYNYLDDNRFQLFGADFGLSKPEATDEAYDDYERCIWNVVRQICR